MRGWVSINILIFSPLLLLTHRCYRAEAVPSLQEFVYGPKDALHWMVVRFAGGDFLVGAAYSTNASDMEGIEHGAQ
jgi:hypothetical protein